jgi:hypothetical protein
VSEGDNRPRWEGRKGRYEVWFLTMSEPQGAAGYWIRYTVRAPITGPPERRLWFARFDRRTPRLTFGLHGSPATDGGRAEPEPTHVRVGNAALGPGFAWGAISGEGREVRWDLRWRTGQPTFRVLPAPFYRVAPTKPFTPNPDTRFGGWIEVDGVRAEVEGFPGQQGHLYGTRHDERWAWASCSSFREGGFVFQALSAQGRRGPFLTPFLTFAGLRIDDRWIRFRGTERSRTWGLGTWRIRLAARDYWLEGRVHAPDETLIRARYLDPDDTPRFCHNSEVASTELLLWERRAGGWQEVADLVSDGTTHAEWAGRTPATRVTTEHREVA